MNDLTVPYLRIGTGQTPADGGCVMQIADWIYSGGWSDNPGCVHPVLRRLAIAANDQLADGERQQLLDLLPRLMNTNREDKMLSVRLAIFCALRVLPLYEQVHPGDDRPRKAIEAAERWCEAPSEAARNAAANAANAAANAANAAAYAAYAAANAAYAAAYAAYAAYAYAAYAAAYAAYAAYAYADAADAAANAADAEPAYKLLLATLDEYERLTSKQGDPVDLGEVTAMLAEANPKCVAVRA